jgi:hypothetical protein
MQTDGMWTGEFATTDGSFGGGVVLLTGDKVFGGDSGYVYSGILTVDEKVSPAVLRASLQVEPFIEGYVSIFKTTGQPYNLEIVGRFSSEDVIIGHGSSPEFPGSRLSLRLSRRKAK